MEPTKTNSINLNNWIVKTFYGWLIGFVLVVVLAMLLDRIGVTSQFFVGTGMAAGVGFMQARILRKKLGWNWDWMWTTVIGMTTSFLLFDLGSMVWSASPKFNLPLSIVLGSLLVGVLQFRILKSKSLKYSKYWILVCFLGWSAAGSMVGLSDYLNQVLPRNPISIIPFILLVLVISSILLGWITGKGLAMILKKGSRTVQ